VKAVILAGGEGTRLRPLTSNTPKPMLPMANRPMMEHIVRLLAHHGFDEIIVTVAFLANQIRNHFGDGAEFGVSMRYATEDTPLGTAGSVRNAADELDEPFLVISGDVLTDVDLSAFVAAHRAAGALASIALKQVENPLEFGIVITEEDGSIERFLEKPTWGQVFSDTINTGIYVLDPRIFDYIPPDAVVDFSGDVFPAALADGERLLGHVVEGYWEDVGTLESYLSSHQDMLDERVAVGIGGFRLTNGVWIGEGADLDPGAVVEGPSIVGMNSRVEAGAHIRPYTVLGADVIVRGDSYVERSVVHDHVYLGQSTRLRSTVIGRSSNLRTGVVAEGAVVGDECFIGDRAVINPGVKVYPFKTVESGAVVNSSIVWETRGARTLFGRRGASGLANVDITSESASRLALAYASSLPKGAVVTVSRDTSRAARALKRSVIGALNLAGANVDDMELATVPLTRFQVLNSQAAGGISVRLAPGDPTSIEIRIFDPEGRDIDEAFQRRIERLLYREDFRRAFAADIGDIVFPPRTLDYYTAALERIIDRDRLRERAFKVVIDYSYGASSLALPSVFAKVGAEVLAVNPFAATRIGAGSLEDREERARRIGDLVRASGSDLGVVLDADGETALFIDDTGHVLDPSQTLLALVSLVAETQPGSRIALPVSVSREAERIAAAHDVSIEWTKLAAAHLMEVASTGTVVFAASLEQGFIWPEFLPAYDATATLVRLLDLLARTGRSLSEAVRRQARVHVAHEAVGTPWDRKGTVMREMVERNQDRDLLLVDGVKIDLGDAWVLVLPDPEDPTVHVWAESGSDHEAAQLAAEYARRIRLLAG
jgi:mannose-1-phosphate guanylyltransferase/phosphomannomutase